MTTSGKSGWAWRLESVLDRMAVSTIIESKSSIFLV
jgi:hypothetical protein